MQIWVKKHDKKVIIKRNVKIYKPYYLSVPKTSVFILQVENDSCIFWNAPLFNSINNKVHGLLFPTILYSFYLQQENYYYLPDHVLNYKSILYVTLKKSAIF